MIKAARMPIYHARPGTGTRTDHVPPPASPTTRPSSSTKSASPTMRMIGVAGIGCIWPSSLLFQYPALPSLLFQGPALRVPPALAPVCLSASPTMSAVCACARVRSCVRVGATLVYMLFSVTVRSVCSCRLIALSPYLRQLSRSVRISINNIYVKGKKRWVTIRNDT